MRFAALKRKLMSRPVIGLALSLGVFTIAPGVQAAPLGVPIHPHSVHNLAVLRSFQMDIASITITAGSGTPGISNFGTGNGTLGTITSASGIPGTILLSSGSGAFSISASSVNGLTISGFVLTSAFGPQGATAPPITANSGSVNAGAGNISAGVPSVLVTDSSASPNVIPAATPTFGTTAFNVTSSAAAVNDNATAGIVNINLAGHVASQLCSVASSMRSSEHDDDEDRSQSNDTTDVPLYHEVALVQPAQRPTFQLPTSSMLFAPTKDMVVETKCGRVAIAKKAVVLIAETDTTTAVYDLHDQHQSDVTVSTGGSSITLSPGRCVFASRDQLGSVNALNPVRCIAYKNVKLKQHEGGTAAVGEFSIASAINGLKVFRQLLGTDRSADARILNDVMKSAAAVSYLPSGSEPYRKLSSR